MDKIFTLPLDISRTTEHIHVILVLSNQTLSTLLSQRNQFLHASEHAYFSTLNVEKRQQSYLLGRYLAKTGVSKYMNERDLRKIEIARGVFQQPIVKYPSNEPLQVSISHSQRWGAALVTPEAHPMAVDIEFIDHSCNLSSIVMLTQNEKKILQDLSLSETAMLTVIWSIKEALSKVLKTGLTTEFSIYEISSIKMDKHHIESQFVNFTQYKVKSWFFNNYAWSIVLPKKSHLAIKLIIDWQENLTGET